jgi:hypothetical protein
MRHARVPVWVWAILACIHLAALIWSCQTANWDFPDSGRYVQAASNLKQHGELYARSWTGTAPQGQSVQEFTIRPPGYPVMVWGLRGSGQHVLLLLIAQNGLSLLALGVVLNWWARWVRPTGKQWAAALVCVITFPAQFIYANAVMSEIALQAVVVTMMVASLAFIRTERTIYLCCVLGAEIVALLLKPVFYPLAIVLVGVGVWLSWHCRRFIFAFLGLIPVLVVGSYMGWNKQRTGYFHFSSISEINLLHYNAAGVVRQLEGPQAEEKWVAGVLKEAGAQHGFAKRQHLIHDRAKAVLLAHPLAYARQHVLGMGALFIDPGRFDISEFLGLKPLVGGGFLAQVRAGGLMQAVGRLPLALLGGLAIIMLANIMRLLLAVRGFRGLRNDTPELRYGRWIAVGLLGYVALLTGPLGAARFLVPVWPLLLGLALVGIQARKDVRLQGETSAASE